MFCGEIGTPLSYTLVDLTILRFDADTIENLERGKFRRDG